MTTELGFPTRRRVLILEEQLLIGKALAALLAPDPEIDVIGEIQSIDEFAACRCVPDVIVLDLDHRGNAVTRFVEQVRAVTRSPRLCVIATHLCAGDLERCLDLGIEGMVVKDALPIEFIRAVKMVADGEFYVDPRLAGSLLRRRIPMELPPASLTPREQQIVRLIADGLSNKEIGLQLSVSEKTVKSHLGRIFSKLKISGRTSAAVLAIKAGLA